MKMRRLTADGEDLLVRILAQSDGLFRPWRNLKAPGWGCLWRMRRDYFTSGLPWALGGADGSARKAVERLVGRLARGGWVRTDGRGRTVSIKLTVKGESRARDLAILPGLPEGLTLLVEVGRLHAELGGVGDCGRDGEWVPESLLCGMEWGAAGFEDRAVILELFALPLLTAGLLESRASRGGHVYYRLTETGAAQAQGMKTATKTAGPFWRWGEVAVDYVQERRRYQAVLESTRGDPQEIGDLPMGGWSTEFHQRYVAKMKAMGAAPAGAIEGAGGAGAIEGGG